MTVDSVSGGAILLEAYVPDAPWVRCHFVWDGGADVIRSCSTDGLFPRVLATAVVAACLLLAILFMWPGQHRSVRRGGWILISVLLLWLTATGGLRHFVMVFDRSGPLLGDSVWHPSMLLKN